MQRIDLKEAGAEFIMPVREILSETQGRKEYWLFRGPEAEIRMPADSAKGRLQRMKLNDVQQLVGKVVRFGRSTKTTEGGIPYWEMDVVTVPGSATGNGSTSAAPVPAGTQTPAKAGAAGAAPRPTKSYSDLYIAATDVILDKIIPKFREAKYPMPLDPRVVAGMIATLFDAKVHE